jgi:hypothetical protein
MTDSAVMTELVGYSMGVSEHTEGRLTTCVVASSLRTGCRAARMKEKCLPEISPGCLRRNSGLRGMLGPESHTRAQAVRKPPSAITLTRAWESGRVDRWAQTGAHRDGMHEAVGLRRLNLGRSPPLEPVILQGRLVLPGWPAPGACGGRSLANPTSLIIQIQLLATSPLE